MGDVAQGMLRDAMTVLRRDNQELLEDVERRDDQLDYLEREIKLFLSRLGHETMSPDLAGRRSRSSPSSATSRTSATSWTRT